MQEKKISKTSSDVKAAKTPEVKAEVKEVAKKVETAAEKTAQSATAAVKEAAKKTSAVKKTVKKAAAKKKEEAKTDVIVQLWDKEFNLSALEDKVKAQFVADGHRAGCIKNLNIYAKPEEGKAYYVINDGKFTGEVYLF
jgi:hypothetical protein